MTRKLLLGLLLIVGCSHGRAPDDLISVADSGTVDAAQETTATALASIPHASLIAPLAGFTPTPGCCTASSTGSASSANQLTEIASLASIDSKTPALVGGSVPVNITGTIVASTDVSDRAARLLGVTYGSQGQPTKQTAANYNAAAELYAGATAYDARQIRALTSADQVTTVPSGTQTVTGPLTDTQLRASAVPVSGAFYQATQPVSIAASVAVTGPVTDAQLRATPLPISGTVTSTPSGTQTVAGTVAVSSVAGAVATTSANASQADGHSADIGALADTSSANTLIGLLKAVKAAVQGTLAVSGTFWQATQPISAASLPLPTGAALDTSVNGILVAQASTTAGESGPMCQGATTTAAPTYVTGKTNPFSLTTAGALRVDGSGATQPVSAALLPLPAGAATSALQGGGLPAALVGGRLDVNVGAGTITVTPSGTQAVSSASSSFVDGHDVTLGTTSDASTATTVIGRLQKLVALLGGGFPSALVGGRLDQNVGAWLGSTAPTVGAKATASSIPVAIATDQVAFPVNAYGGAAVGASPSGNPIVVAGSDGSVVRNIATDNFGRIKGAGYSYYHITSATIANVKSGAGILHCITFGYGAGVSTITIWDNTTNAAPIVAGLSNPAGAIPSTNCPHWAMGNGIEFQSTGGTVDITLAYE